MTPQAQGLRPHPQAAPPDPADPRRAAGIENAVRRLLVDGVITDTLRAQGQDQACDPRRG
jgi:hypothetical protein